MIPAENLPVFAKPMHIVRPTLPPLSAIADKLSLAMESGQVTNNGPWVQAFEQQLTEYLGVPTIVFSSGQAALMIMVQAAQVRGGEVITTAFTFPGTPHSIRWAGADPVFADIIDDGSLCLDPADVERRITDRTRAILSVDPYGIASDYRALQGIADRHGLKLLVDSAPSFGSRVGGQLIGGFGAAQIFSFHATKAFNTMEGGALSSHDAALIERAKCLRNFGLLPNTDSPYVGMNGKMMEMCALIGLEQLKTFDAVADVRRAAAQRIGAGLSMIPGLRPGRAPAGQDPIWLYMPVEVDPALFGCDRNELNGLLAKQNLHVRNYYSPACHQLSTYADLSGVSLPIAERAAANVVATPIYNTMTASEADGVVEAFRRVHLQVRNTSVN